MALTQTDLDALDVAIASSELEVRLEGRSVKYRSTDELLKARQHVAEVLRTAGGSANRSSFRFNFATQRD
jgi:hypothetical protein